MNKEVQYDAIVAGSEINGGWATKEFCENSLKILGLKRRPMIKYMQDYKIINDDLCDYPLKELAAEHYNKVAFF